MERIHVTVGPQTIDFRASLTVEAVKNEIRGSCVLQGGRLELDGLVLIEGDDFVPETTYSFVGGIPLAAAPGGATATGPTVADILVGQNPRCDPNVHVIRRMMRHYAAAVNNALIARDAELLSVLYEEAELLPYTQTAKELSAVGTGYVLDGLLINGNDSLNICFKDGVPYVLKVLNASEYDRVNAWKEAASESTESCRYIVLFDAVNVNKKYFIFMPMYPITLESLPVMDTKVLHRFYRQMCDALRCFHRLGFAHMDFKPANILITGDGDFILADLGSVIRMGQRSESTQAYIPREMWDRERSSPIASATVDWWMMAVTVCEKACGYKAGSGPESAKKDDIEVMLKKLGDVEENKEWVRQLLEYLSND